MSKMVLYRNNSDHIQYPGGKTVRPGDSRMVEACYCGKGQNAPESFMVEKFLDQPVNEIKKLVNDLSDEHLSLAIIAESDADKPRKSLLERLEAELEERQLNLAKGIVLQDLEQLETATLQARLLEPENTQEDNTLIQSVLGGRLVAGKGNEQSE